MVQQDDGTLSAEECGTLEGKFAERTRRVNALFELDRVLADAANRYNLAADIVRHGWPHCVDRPRRAD